MKKVMNLSKKILLLAPIVCFSSQLSAQDISGLFDTLKDEDSLLFNVGFNTCDINVFESLISDDFEFYHDQGGITLSKSSFIDSIKENICNLDYKPRRELVEKSLDAFPLYNNGKLYGAIQIGEHKFYAVYADGKEEHTSTAKFTHVWLNKDGKWTLSRSLSYDHQKPEQ